MQVDSRFIDKARHDLAGLLAAYPELEEDDVLRLDMIEGGTSVMELLDQLIKAERETVCLEDALDQEIDRLKKRQARFELRRAAIRKGMMQLMESAGLRKLERPTATISIAAGRPKVIITDESLIPKSYHRVKTEIDKEAISKTLKALGTVPGATLSNSEPQLRIS